MSFWSNAWSQVKDYAKGIWSNLGDVLANVRDNGGQMINSFLNSTTGADLTGAEKAANDFNAAEAQKQRDFEADMANTEYQRKVRDMKAAGINPMMAAGGSGNSTPSGASASSVSPSAPSMSLSELMLMDRQMKLMDAQKENIEADTRNKGANTEKTLAEIFHINADTQRIKDYSRVLKETAVKLGIENQVSEVLKGVRIEQERMNLVLTDTQLQLLNTTIDKAAKEISLLAEQCETEDAKQSLMSVQESLTKLDVKDKQLYLAYADALYKAKSEQEQSNALDAAVRYAYDKDLLTTDYAKAQIQKAKSEGAISSNLEWNEQLVRDLVENTTPPKSYGNKISKEDWRVMRRGLVNVTYMHVGPVSEVVNSNSIVHR